MTDNFIIRYSLSVSFVEKTCEHITDNIGMQTAKVVAEKLLQTMDWDERHVLKSICKENTDLMDISSIEIIKNNTEHFSKRDTDPTFIQIANYLVELF